MHTQIVQIGNSLGLRLPKTVLESLSLKRAAVLSIQTRGDSIVLRPVKSPRAGWAEAFAGDSIAAEEDLWEGLPATEGWAE